MHALRIHTACSSKYRNDSRTGIATCYIEDRGSLECVTSEMRCYLTSPPSSLQYLHASSPVPPRWHLVALSSRAWLGPSLRHHHSYHAEAANHQCCHGGRSENLKKAQIHQVATKCRGVDFFSLRLHLELFCRCGIYFCTLQKFKFVSFVIFVRLFCDSLLCACQILPRITVINGIGIWLGYHILLGLGVDFNVIWLFIMEYWITVFFSGIIYGLPDLWADYCIQCIVIRP